MPERIFGHIPGFPVGSWFESGAELAAAGLHRPLVAGISGTEADEADSIVLSGGYEDDQDLGDEILYTGQGGRDQNTGKQVAHQKLNRGNLALAKSKLKGLPVRVICGSAHKSNNSPSTGYRYDGLYRVEDFWQEKGRAGYYVWRYRLVKFFENEIFTSSKVTDDLASYSISYRQETNILRIVRDTNQARRIKELYDYCCQVCSTRFEGAVGPYAEAAHIRPLGIPHNGCDSVDNLLCLCPNHHVLFDYGAFSVADNLSLIGIEGVLTVIAEHKIHPDNLRYHREHYYLKQGEL
ncbi:HNH endonuclease [Trichocoleus sp. FACHB-591]|uniref:YDG/SRA domain-containing protein n=1 Tax=Trichocoleus sp. FACHB-591 TaxID=2692872 RepID=UPI001685BAF1|nr:YDG/SRA domain-containing protein [Trichocoleus sp. FACHB-591]MBD2095448.1 HNH endonuclease [Trichocoleus sp. FACHB-591]